MDPAALARVLRAHYGGLAPSAPPAWGPPLRVLDAALAVDLEADAVRIERARYRADVLAPVEAFRRRHPDARTLADLRDRIAPDPEAFARRALGADPRRGPVALALVAFLLDRLDQSAWADLGATEAERLAEAVGPGWTDGSDHGDVASPHVGAHGLAYLQMRLGAAVVVPEPAVVAFLDEGAEGEGDASVVADAIRRAGLPPLAVLQALRADWVRGRAWGAPPPEPGGAERWPPFVAALVAALGAGRPPWEAVVALHRAAPCRPPGLDAAERGDTLGTHRALARSGRGPSFAAVARETLRALYLDADGQGFDAEAASEAAHAAAHDLARALRATGEPVGADVLGPLRGLFEAAGRRTTRHWWRRTWT